MAPRSVRTVHFVRQAPLNNYVGGVLADELRVVYGHSALDPEAFREKLRDLIHHHLDLDPELLGRSPSWMSSGEQQMVAIGLAMLADADLLLLDEPFARLSRKHMQRVLALLRSHVARKYVAVAMHPAEEGGVVRSGLVVHRRRVQFAARRLEVCEEASEAQVEVEETIEALGDVTELGLDPASLAEEWEAFADLPRNGVKSVRGSGPSIFSGQLQVDVAAKTRVLTRATALDLHEGVNLLYGENGAGKTLVAQALAGEFAINPVFRIGRPVIAEVGGDVQLRLGGGVSAMPAPAGLRWLRKAGRSIYFPAEPERFIAEATARLEVGSLHAAGDLEERLAWLAERGVGPDVNRSELSYGQQKLMALATLPTHLDLAILDEPFANLARPARQAVADLILGRVERGEWRAVAITTNRPIDTISSLRTARPHLTGILGAINGRGVPKTSSKAFGAGDRMTTATLVEKILDGHFQHERRGHLVHPVVKLLFTAVPLFLGTYTLPWLGGARPWGALILMLLVLLTGQSLDFRANASARTAKWVMFFLLGVFVVVLAEFSVVDLERVVGRVGLPGFARWLGETNAGRAVLSFTYFGVAARGVRRFGAVDALWMARMPPFRWFRRLYLAVIYTHFVLRTTLGEQFSAARTVSGIKARQARRAHGWRRGEQVRVRVFAQRLLEGFEEMARLAFSLLKERGLYQFAANNTIPMTMSPEDWCAVLMLTLAALFFAH